jgi:hypothetical protein
MALLPWRASRCCWIWTSWCVVVGSVPARLLACGCCSLRLEAPAQTPICSTTLRQKRLRAPAHMTARRRCFPCKTYWVWMGPRGVRAGAFSGTRCKRRRHGAWQRWLGHTGDVHQCPIEIQTICGDVAHESWRPSQTGSQNHCPRVSRWSRIATAGFDGKLRQACRALWRKIPDH